jgi:hypothetical protein
MMVERPLKEYNHMRKRKQYKEQEYPDLKPLSTWQLGSLL